MIAYMKRHEQYVREMLAANLTPQALNDLLVYHNHQIQWMQQERLAHLITMLFVCLFTLLTWGLAIALPAVPCFVLAALLMILAIAYIIQYYRLENGVQKWYELSREIRLHRQQS
jgi:hypothetical protein